MQSNPGPKYIAENDPTFEVPNGLELPKWKEMEVFVHPNERQQAISTQWVCNERSKGSKKELKARLCVRRCENMKDIPTDSPTGECEIVRLSLVIAIFNQWTVNSSDVKST